MSHSELFKRSLEAEYQITDYNACHYKGCDNVGWFPHSYLLPKRFLKILGIFSWLMPLLIPFWALLVLPIFLVKDCVGLVWQKRVIRQPNNSSGLLSRFFLGASTTETLQSVSRVETLPKTYLYLPWRQFPDDLPKSMRPLSLIDIITMRDLYRAVWVAWLEVIKLAMRPSSWGLVLYAYTSFRWFVVLFALLEKKPKEVWISNHYDRWAILLDGIDLDKKVMVQHGDLVMKSAIKNSFVIFGPEPKLKSDWNLLYFTKGASRQFEAHIFDKPLKSKQKFSLQIDQNPQCFLTPSVLVVGCPALRKVQEEEIEKLYEKFGKKLTIIYRPHPRKIMFDSAVLKRCGVILETKSVPKTTAIVSYYSTFNQVLQEVSDCPIFVFDYRDLRQVSKVREELYDLLSDGLRGLECAE